VHAQSFGLNAWFPPRFRIAARRCLAGASMILAVTLAVTARAQASCPPESTIRDRVFGGGLCLVASTFGAESAGERPTLVVVVHGDISDGGAATYHATFAKTLQRPGMVAVALLRPGYVDDTGRKSEGSTFDRSDNYTAANVTAIAGAIDALKKSYRARRVIYVGHSGGAAIGGVLIGRRPGLVDAAVLVSCPCDIPRWLAARGHPPWTRSLSPDFFVSRVPTSTEVVAITGTADDNTFPALAEHYAARLAARGVSARFVPVQGAGHGFSGVAPATKAAVDGLLER
jgi:pimeloyl-ACP methyl ester carboxylesterase